MALKREKLQPALDLIRTIELTNPKDYQTFRAALAIVYGFSIHPDEKTLDQIVPVLLTKIPLVPTHGLIMEILHVLSSFCSASIYPTSIYGVRTVRLLYAQLNSLFKSLIIPTATEMDKSPQAVLDDDDAQLMLGIMVCFKLVMVNDNTKAAFVETGALFLLLRALKVTIPYVQIQENGFVLVASATKFPAGSRQLAMNDTVRDQLLDAVVTTPYSMVARLLVFVLWRISTDEDSHNALGSSDFVQKIMLMVRQYVHHTRGRDFFDESTLETLLNTLLTLATTEAGRQAIVYNGEDALWTLVDTLSTPVPVLLGALKVLETVMIDETYRDEVKNGVRMSTLLSLLSKKTPPDVLLRGLEMLLLTGMPEAVLHPILVFCLAVFSDEHPPAMTAPLTQLIFYCAREREELIGKLIIPTFIDVLLDRKRTFQVLGQILSFFEDASGISDRLCEEMLQSGFMRLCYVYFDPLIPRDETPAERQERLKYEPPLNGEMLQLHAGLLRIVNRLCALLPDIVEAAFGDGGIVRLMLSLTRSLRALRLSSTRKNPQLEERLRTNEDLAMCVVARLTRMIPRDMMVVFQQPDTQEEFIGTFLSAIYDCVHYPALCALTSLFAFLSADEELVPCILSVSDPSDEYEHGFVFAAAQRALAMVDDEAAAKEPGNDWLNDIVISGEKTLLPASIDPMAVNVRIRSRRDLHASVYNLLLAVDITGPFFVNEKQTSVCQLIGLLCQSHNILEAGERFALPLCAMLWYLTQLERHAVAFCRAGGLILFTQLLPSCVQSLPTFADAVIGTLQMVSRHPSLRQHFFSTNDLPSTMLRVAMSNRLPERALAMLLDTMLLMLNDIEADHRAQLQPLAPWLRARLVPSQMYTEMTPHLSATTRMLLEALTFIDPDDLVITAAHVTAAGARLPAGLVSATSLSYLIGQPLAGFQEDSINLVEAVDDAYANMLLASAPGWVHEDPA